MATLTIRNLDDRLKRDLRSQAAGNNRSMEEEAREALRHWVRQSSPTDGGGLGSRLRQRFAALGGADLEIPPRGPGRPLPDFFSEE